MSVVKMIWLAVSLVALIALVAFAVKRLVYFFLAISYRLKAHTLSTELPDVLIAVPCRDEASVIKFNIDSVSKIDYPKQKLKVIYVDDGSTDGTTKILKQMSSEIGFDWFRLESNQKRSKSRALNEAINRFEFGELIYILDADFKPTPSVLKLATNILEKYKLAMVTGKVIAENPWSNAISAYSSIEELTHQHITQAAQSSIGLGSTPMGGNYIIRRDVLQALGGFDESMLLEDVDIALRLFERSQKSAFLPEMVACHHVPKTIKTFTSQHYFWSRGFNQATKKHLKKILLASGLNIGKKLAAILFSFGYTDRLAVMLGAIASAGSILKANPFFPLWIWLFIFALPLAHVILALLKERKENKLWSIAYLPLVFPLDIFAATKAALDDLLGKPLLGYKTRRE